MKQLHKILMATAILSASSIPTFAQGTITSVIITPSNPSTTDTIRVYADCMFSSGGCKPSATAISKLGNAFSATGAHCPGMLTYICSYTDSFIIAPQPAGIYTFKFNLYTGNPQVIPCGTNLTDTDSQTFTVHSSTSVSTIFPNNAKLWYAENKLHLHLDSPTDQYQLRVTNTTGELLLKQPITGTENVFPIDVPAGIYTVSLTSMRNMFTQKILIQ